MEELTTPLNPIPDVITCENCNTNHPPDKKFCSECSFPIQGTEDEKTSFRLTVGSRKRLLKDAEEKVKGAKTMIYVAAGLFFISGLILFVANDDVESFVMNLVISLIYLILASWSNRNPFGAIVTAFAIYITIQVLAAFVDPTNIVRGIILKFIIIAAFVKGIRSAIEARSIMGELEKVRAVPDGNR